MPPENEENTTATMAEEEKAEIEAVAQALFPEVEPEPEPEPEKQSFIQLSNNEGLLKFELESGPCPVGQHFADSMIDQGRNLGYTKETIKMKLLERIPSLRIHTKAHAPYCYTRSFDWMEELLRWQGEKFDIVIGTGGRITDHFRSDRIETFQKEYQARHGKLSLQEILTHAGELNNTIFRISQVAELHMSVTPPGGCYAQYAAGNGVSWHAMKFTPFSKEHQMRNEFHSQDLSIETVLTTEQNYTIYPYNQ